MREKKNGKYSSFEDFIRRVDDKVINKKFLESAIKSGLFDSLDQNRKTLFENLDRLIEVVSEDKNNKNLVKTAYLVLLKVKIQFSKVLIIKLLKSILILSF